MEGHHPHHHHQLHPQVAHLQPHQYGAGLDTGGGGADRFPQWSVQETREFLMIRAELDPTFMQTKRNKLLWEIIATKMKEKGFHRSAEQCKCKWKNLVTRYKGCETLDPEGMRQQFPYYSDLQALFNARMQRILWMEAEGGSGSKKMMKAAIGLSSDEDEENEDSETEAEANKISKKKRKVVKSSGGGINSIIGSGNMGINSVREILDDFLKQQMQMEAEWMKAMETRENERQVREMEWRQTMEAPEKERLMMERQWREREEQRRKREEARAEKRDTLINALLNNLIRRED